MRLKSYLIAFLLCFLWQVPAHAKGIPIINTGEELFEVAPFPEKYNDQYEDLQNYKAGYKCSRFGLFWADIWTWNCSLVAIESAESDSYADVPADILAEIQNQPAYAMSQSKRSFWNHYGIVVLILLIVGYGAYALRKRD